MNQHLLSIVIPLLNEEANLEPLYHELKSILASTTYFTTHEIIFVNDGSTDQSLSILKNIAHQDQSVKVISFTRNFGHEKATYAGIVHAQGEALVILDADRQDPPSLILTFEKEFTKGYHIIFGQRTKRLHESFIKKLTSKAFYPLFKAVTKIDMPRDVGDFCLLSRKAIDCIKQMPERNIFVRGFIYWTGLSKKAVPFVRQGRNAGKSNYNYRKLMIFALDNIISFSILPLYFILFFSCFMFMGCMIATLVSTVMYAHGQISALTLYMSGMLFVLSGILCCLGMIGLYVGKIFQEIKQRPLFLIEEKINFEKPQHSFQTQNAQAQTNASHCSIL